MKVKLANQGPPGKLELKRRRWRKDGVREVSHKQKCSIQQVARKRPAENRAQVIHWFNTNQTDVMSDA